MKLVATLVGFGTIAVLAIVGVNVWLYYAAFGQARCAGINAFAVIPLVVEAVILIIGLVMGLDMLSDMSAASNARKGAVDANKDLVAAFKAQQAQAGAMYALQKLQPKPGGPDMTGGVNFDEGLFAPNMPGES